MADLRLPLAVERQVLAWFDPPTEPDDFDADRFPIFVYEYSVGQTAYGFPRVAGRVKAAVFHGGALVPDPDVVQPEATSDEIQGVRDALVSAFPSLAASPVRSTATCLFTNAPDSRFVIGPHPARPRVYVCSACSGHGFKFAPAVGDAIADLVTTGASAMDLSPFEVTRFLAGP
jgi:sarcosine oxidase